MVGFRVSFKGRANGFAHGVGVGHSTLDNGVALHQDGEGHWFEEVENSSYMLIVRCGRDV